MSILSNINEEKKTKNKNAFNYKHDDEWYTTKEDVEYFIENSKIPKNKIIWCPFDTKDSNFVKIFKKHGYKVVYSHILTGKDFFKYQPKKWDIICSNPPFRNKHLLLDRLLEFGDKQWALIFGIQCLNSEKFCDKLQKFKRPQYIHLKRRMCFTKDMKNYDVLKLERPSFASMWVCNNLFQKDIIVWNGVNYKKDNKEYC